MREKIKVVSEIKFLKLKGCPRCMGGDMFYDETIYLGYMIKQYVCILCGFRHDIDLKCSVKAKGGINTFIIE